MKYLLLISLCLITFLVGIDFFGVTLALSKIGNLFSLNLYQLQWILSIFLICLVSLLITAGRIADIFGFRNIMLLGVICFIAGSAVAGFANSLELILIGRAIQGIGRYRIFIRHLLRFDVDQLRC